MPSPPESPESPPPAGSQLAAFNGGMRAGLVSPLIYVTVGTFLGIGALAHDFGYPLGWTVVTSVVMWAAPAQVILMTMLASGAPLIEIAAAVTLSAVRLLPMVVSLVPLLRTERTRTHHLLLPAHHIAVAMWVEGWRVLPAVPRENRIAFLNGMGISFLVAAMIFTVAGFYLAARLPMAFTAALLMLTPLAFLMSTAGNARALADRLALGLGLVIAPVLAYHAVRFDILWSGVICGTLAYAAHRLWKART